MPESCSPIPTREEGGKRGGGLFTFPTCEGGTGVVRELLSCSYKERKGSGKIRMRASRLFPYMRREGCQRVADLFLLGGMGEEWRGGAC